MDSYFAKYLNWFSKNLGYKSQDNIASLFLDLVNVNYPSASMQDLMGHGQALWFLKKLIAQPRFRCNYSFFKCFGDKANQLFLRISHRSVTNFKYISSISHIKLKKICVRVLFLASTIRLFKVLARTDGIVTNTTYRTLPLLPTEVVVITSHLLIQHVVIEVSRMERFDCIRNQAAVFMVIQYSDRLHCQWLISYTPSDLNSGEEVNTLEQFFKEEKMQTIDRPTRTQLPVKQENQMLWTLLMNMPPTCT